MMKGSEIGIQEKKAKLFNEWERFTSTDEELIESYYHYFSKLMNDFKRNKHFPEKIASNLKFLNNLQPQWSRHITIFHQTKDLHTSDYTQRYDFLKYNQNEADFLAGYKFGGNRGNQFRRYAGQNVGNQVIQNLGIQNVGDHNGIIVVPDIANQNGNGNVVAAWAKGNANRNNGNQIRCYNCRGLGHLARNYTRILMRLKAYNDMQQKIERLQAQLVDQKGKNKETVCVSNTLNPLSQKLENENVELEFQVPQKVDKTNDLSNPVTSNSVPTTKESKVIENDKVIASGMFMINPIKNSREVKSVPNKPINASVWTNLITDPQPHIITKKVVNSDSHGFSSTGIDITTKTRRPQPRSNTKNNRVPSGLRVVASRIKNSK
nr:hypothetical protein [Tanacetum cinerariifolium]